MWKRLNNPRGSHPPATQERDRFNGNMSGEPGLGIHTDERRAPPRPPREDMDPRGLPRLPYDPNPPPPPEHRDSKFRPASSIYSQPSPNPVVTRFQNSYASYPEEEVSPPSSPELERPLDIRSQQHEPDVSPIDEMPDVSRLGLGRPPSRPGSSSKPSSNIPVLRREKRRNQVAAAAENIVQRKEIGDGPKGRIARDPRWDPYTGEITTSDRGKPQSAKPGQFAAPGLRPVHRDTGIVLGNESSVTSGVKAHTSFGDRVRKLKSNDTGPGERPEWRGATGRQTIVSPVKDQFDIPPINIPRKSSKRVASPHSGTQSGASTPVTIIRSGDGETSPASTHMPEHIDPTIRTVLSNSGQNSPRVVESPSTISPDPVVAPLFSSTRRGNTDPVPASRVVQTPKAFEREDTLAGIERNFREAFKGVSVPEVEPYEQPPSRFSVTTYAPSEAHSTPRPSADSERPAMPTPPASYAFQEPSTILDRKRPAISGSPSSNISRKAVNPSSPVFISMSSSIARNKRTSTASSISKTLPMSPAEAASHDLVTQLQAQLDNLAHRRNNITRSIRQMTELMPKDHVILTEEVRRKREDEKRKVEMLREEEADVRREEHDIGLRLHRAWKRRDKDAVYEPTGLWVRRVTG
ncbi:uncharacterized protein LY89DRAFT_702357 [Mollisia scopiformis]|uniref:Uncharacterized protein n=1 Tax=Mollisia scopiformis TaxID=149040 RepID=A0A132B595_MOLSC|nr:uncharacterized protein LY89DRAFT_702357 [Mollisia scopiformis]KUJ07586.1 hypothetical protein LY89DRAFT_702357 [Mollisia scopiformis]